MATEKKFIRGNNYIYLLQPREVPAGELSADVGHHILVVDRSGSMYYDIDKLKQSIEQALTVDSAVGNPDTLTSLISFSSQGDVTLHWSKVKVRDVVDLSNNYVAQIRGLRATALTGISQGLYMGLQQVNRGQTTGMTLFTDGYANHPSASQENRNLDAFVEQAKQVEGLFLNCIGYRSWCDWPRMQRMSNALSGKTIEAKSFGDVLETMKDTQELLQKGARPAVKISPASQAAFVLGINKNSGDVLFSNEGEDLTMAGLSEAADVEAWEVTRIPADEKPRGAKALKKEERWRQAALISALATKVDLREAKDLLFQSGNKTLWEEHQSAMTPSTLVALQNDLRMWVLQQDNDAYKMGRNTKPKHSVFDLAEALNKAPAYSVALQAGKFYENYQRRSEKRIMKAEVDTVSDTVYLRGMSFNSKEATVQLETVANLRLYKNGEHITEVAKVPLNDLKEYRSYTVISSGERNVEEIPVEITSKEGIDVVAPFLIPSKAKKLKVGSKVSIELKRFSMEANAQLGVSDVHTAFCNMAAAQANLKIISAARDKSNASSYSPEQQAALKEYHLTPALYYSPPTASAFEDREKAIELGYIDSYTRYQVNFGDLSILNMGAFRSGNAFLDRFYKVYLAGEEVKKPKLNEVYYENNVTFQRKPPGRGQETKADKLMHQAIERFVSGEQMSRDEVEAEWQDYDKRMKSEYAKLSPLILEIGCTGLLPAHLASQMERYEPEEFAKTFDIKLKKAEKEAIFYVDNDTGLVISVVPQTAWYTTSAGMKALES